jgi:hypothetical protein
MPNDAGSGGAGGSGITIIRYVVQLPKLGRELWEMELHETIECEDKDWRITRVPGGWIYMYKNQPIFVPLNNEFVKAEKA